MNSASIHKNDIDIICLSLSRWDAPISSPALSLAKEFAKTNRVFYIEHPFSWKDYLRYKNTDPLQRRKNALRGGRDIYSNPPELPRNLTIVTPPLVYPVNFLPPGWLYRKLSAVNDDRLQQVFRRVVADYAVKDFIYINFFDPFFLRAIPPLTPTSVPASPPSPRQALSSTRKAYSAPSPGSASSLPQVSSSTGRAYSAPLPQPSSSPGQTLFPLSPPPPNCLKFVYQCMDDLSQVAYTRRHGVQLEEEIIRRADITLCTSRELTQLKSTLSDRVYFHPNAVDFDLFRTAFDRPLSRPADLDFGDKKIIGFTGSIEYRTDFSLLKKLAEQHPDKVLFLLGPIAGREHIEAGLNLLSNIVFAGARNIAELPAYLQHFDCCIIPYKKNTLTRSIYPLKINEYLAAGKPVVATAFSEDILSFNDVAYIEPDHESFIRAIDRAIQENNNNKRQQRFLKAQTNSWSARVAEFWKIVFPENATAH